MHVDLHPIFKRVVEIELERLDGLKEQVDAQYDVEREQLVALGGDEDEGIEFYADELYVLGSIRDVAAELRTVGLYRIVELNTTKMIDWRFGVGSARAHEVHKLHKLKQYLKSTLGLELSGMPGYRSVDELRCLNNVVKHSGVISKELARYSEWQEGKELANLESALARLRPDIPLYLLEELGEAVLPSGAR